MKGVLVVLLLMVLAASAVSAVESNGYFVGAISYPKTVVGGDSVTIKGTYYVTKTGPFVLEGYIDAGTRQPLAVSVVSSKSSCDSSSYWAGSQILGQAGETYNFAFTVKAPTTPGKYDIAVHVWTDCWKNGGEMITQVRNTITVSQARCDATNVISALGSSLLAAGNPIWALTTPVAKNILTVYGCTANDMVVFCGSQDTDSDGIPDGCDYCPVDKGIPQTYNGCHPCFGKDYTTSAGKQCYRTYFEEYGIPKVIAGVVNPVVQTKLFCQNGQLVTQLIHEFGNWETASKVSCPTGSECTEKTGGAVCQEKANPVEIAWQGVQCSGGNLLWVTKYSDDTSKSVPYINCEFGCEGTKCKQSDICQDNSYCTLPEVCINGDCAIPPGWCDASHPCPIDQECLGGLCVIKNVTSECAQDSDCPTAKSLIPTCIGNLTWSCVSEHCLGTCDEPPVPCEEDTVVRCPSGVNIVTAKCVNGKLVPDPSATCLDDCSQAAYAMLHPDICNPPCLYDGGCPNECKGISAYFDGDCPESDAVTYVLIGMVIIGGGAYFLMRKPKKGGRRR